MIDAHDSLIVRTMARLLIPLIQLFAVYVLVFGQYGSQFLMKVLLPRARHPTPFLQ